MPLEIEVKLKVESHEGVRARLRELGEFVGKVPQYFFNLLYDLDSGKYLFRLGIDAWRRGAFSIIS